MSSEFITPTLAKLKTAWMAKPFAGPTEKFDCEVNFDQLIINLRAGIIAPIQGSSELITPTVEKLKTAWMRKPFAGPTEKFDCGVNFDQFITDLQAGRV